MSLKKGYSELISEVMMGFGDNFGALASPTLSKQETVTILFKSIEYFLKDSSKKPAFPWKRLFEFIPRLILMFIRVSYASLRFKIQGIPSNAVIFRTWLVPRSFQKDGLVDDYFRQLPVDLAQVENVLISFTSTDLSLLKQFGSVRRSKNQIMSYGLLTLFDVIRLFLDYIFTALIQIKKRYKLEGKDVTSCINHSLLLDYLELRSFEAYTEKYKCKKLIQYNIKAFVYVFENQSWEKVCCYIFRNKGIRIIGYQSSGFSPVFLNFFPSQLDSEMHPMPDILLTVGNHFRNYLLENGHYSINIKTFAAMRFFYPSVNGIYLIDPPELQVMGRILYAFPVQFEQYEPTIKDLISVFKDSKIQVDLKFHPLYQLSDIKNIFSLPDNFCIVNEVNVDLLSKTYDCVLFNDNSFGIESLLKGVKSYQYCKNLDFLDDRYIYFDLWKVNFSLDDVFQLKEKIENCTYDKSFSSQAVSRYINSMYHPYSQKSFNQFINLLK
jgi:hypothetical protein